MDKTEEELKICLCGYDREQVNKYIKDMKLDHEEKIQELKKNLSMINEENEKLSDEIQKLKDEIELEMKSEQFMKFALKKIEEVVPIIRRISSEETSRITLLGKKQEEIFNKKIEEYNNIIKGTQEDMNLLLKKQLEKSESLSKNLKSFIKNKCDSTTCGKLSIKTEYSDKTELKNDNVKEDINRIRNKYLIGKVAGKDLVDNKGNIIVSKDSIITEETITRAEKEGKLPELIVNMTITDI